MNYNRLLIINKNFIILFIIIFVIIIINNKCSKNYHEKLSNIDLRRKPKIIQPKITWLPVIDFGYDKLFSKTSTIATDSTGINLVFISYDGFIYKSSNSGNNWSYSSYNYTDSKDNSINRWVNLERSGSKIISNIDGTYLFVCVESNGIYSYSNNRWTKTRAPNTYWNFITCDSTGKYVAAASLHSDYNLSTSKIYISSNYGETWNNKLNFNNLCTYMKSNFSGSNIVACLDSNVIYISKDFGNSWSQINNNLNGMCSAVINDNGSAIIVASNSGLHKFNFNSNFNLLNIIQIYSSKVTSITSDRILKNIIISTDTGLHASYNYGNSWTQLSEIPISINDNYRLSSTYDGKKIFANNTVNIYIGTYIDGMIIRM